MANEGYRSVEDHAGDCTEFFRKLLQESEKTNVFEEEILQVEIQRIEILRTKVRRIGQKEEISEIFLPARYLRERYGLDWTEYWLILFAFCCEVEEGLCLSFREKYHEKWPTLQYALHLLSQIFPVNFETIGAFCEKKSIFGELWSLHKEGADEGGILTRPLLLARAPFYFLLTGRIMQEDWYTPFLPQEEENLPEPPYPLNINRNIFLPALHAKEAALLARELEDGAGRRILLHGGQGCGKHVLMRRVCESEKKNLVFVQLSRMQARERRERMQNLRTLYFLYRILSPVLAFEISLKPSDPAEKQEENRELLECFAKGIPGISGEKLIFLTENNRELSLVEKIPDRKIFLAETLSVAERRELLDLCFLPEERWEWQEELAGRFHTNIGELSRRCKELLARAKAEQRQLDEKALWEEIFFEGNGIASAVPGKFVKERATIDEIVLAPDCKRQLGTLIRLAKAWTGRKALQLLFHGSSGTGKTMAASVLAGELARPLFKVDLSQIFDKYIGETEKHIDEIFRLAERGSYLLFFDEADALFARRTKIQDSHDRYANASTSYLLQRMEEYHGVLVLATNLMGHFDDAFVRRIQFVIRFQKPGDKERELLWEKALSGEIPIGNDISYAELARAAQLSPARIHSAAQVAKMLALCDGGGCMTREIVRKALELEAGKDETRLQFAGGN